MESENECKSETFTPPYCYVFKFLLQAFKENVILPRDLFRNLIEKTEQISENLFPSRDFLLSFPPNNNELQEMLDDIIYLHNRIQVELGSRECDLIFQDADLVMTLNLIEERIENFAELRDLTMSIAIFQQLTKYGYLNHTSLLRIVNSDKNKYS